MTVLVVGSLHPLRSKHPWLRVGLKCASCASSELCSLNLFVKLARHGLPPLVLQFFCVGQEEEPRGLWRANSISWLATDLPFVGSSLWIMRRLVCCCGSPLFPESSGAVDARAEGPRALTTITPCISCRCAQPADDDGTDFLLKDDGNDIDLRCVRSLRPSTAAR